eukprot:5545972-Pleurochrysis_carterae.AAC.1
MPIFLSRRPFPAIQSPSPRASKLFIARSLRAVTTVARTTNLQSQLVLPPLISLFPPMLPPRSLRLPRKASLFALTCANGAWGERDPLSGLERAAPLFRGA